LSGQPSAYPPPPLDLASVASWLEISKSIQQIKDTVRNTTIRGKVRNKWMNFRMPQFTYNCYRWEQGPSRSSAVLFIWLL
jgi:hypothetical protein